MRPFPPEDEGKDWFMGFLEKKGFTDIRNTDSSDVYAHYDISARYGGEEFIFELKNRDDYFMTHMDAGLDKERYEFLRDAPVRAFYVCFWNDCWTVIDVKRHPPKGEEDIVSRWTTRFTDSRARRHTLSIWDIKDIVLWMYD